MDSASLEHQEDVSADVSQQLTISAIVFSVICPLLVTARIVGRFKLRHQLGNDDVVIILAVQSRTWTERKLIRIKFWQQCFSVALCVTMCLLAKWGIGKTNAEIEPSVLKEIIKLFLTSQSIYKITTALTKASILLLYLRVFPQKIFRRICWTFMGIIALDATISVMLTTFQCDPIHRAWNLEVEGTCIDLMTFWLVNGAYSIASDIIVLILPLPMIYALQLPRKVKIGLMVVFGLGLFVCVTSVLRLVAMIESDKYCHPSWKGLPFSLWSLIEANIAIICAFMPTLKVIISKLSTQVYASFTKLGSKTSSPRRDSSATIVTTYVESPQRCYSRDSPDRVYEKKIPLSTQIPDLEPFSQFIDQSDFEARGCSIARSATSGERTDVSP